MITNTDATYQHSSHSRILDGGLPFTKSFRNIRLKSKLYTTFRVVSVEKFREKRNILKVSPVFPVGKFQTKIRCLMNLLGPYSALNPRSLLYDAAAQWWSSWTSDQTPVGRTRSLIYFILVVTRMDTPKSGDHLHSKYMIGVIR